ncbi:hypothetical protein H1R17_07075 [Flavobacterium sp. xlx-214]|uniref:hypothetical protein n=1 Tax=unclassified Flavobacterium TaxID=196869 RepID=UPI0013D80E3E|nr:MULTISPECIES: hypothetical protein [unclassified Flavobacterium]MBA5793820.1 hypothetical protein [Flavobacterium sp. xlx-221]QMI84878.1 hypothetical protein H1R17_07075 [Flavobacterium sp. xlx-214]
MKKYLSQILALLFLLVIAGSKLTAIGQQIPTTSTSKIVDKVVNTHKHSIKAYEHRLVKYASDQNSFTTIEADAQDFDFSDLFTFVAITAKVLVFAFILSFLNTKYKKHRFFYDAFIRLFSTKYIVLRTLRI